MRVCQCPVGRSGQYILDKIRNELAKGTLNWATSLRTIPVTWGGETGVEIIDPSIPRAFGQTTAPSLRFAVPMSALAQRQNDVIIPYYGCDSRRSHPLIPQCHLCDKLRILTYESSSILVTVLVGLEINTEKTSHSCWPPDAVRKRFISQ